MYNCTISYGFCISVYSVSFFYIYLESCDALRCDAKANKFSTHFSYRFLAWYLEFCQTAHAHDRDRERERQI